MPMKDVLRAAEQLTDQAHRTMKRQLRKWPRGEVTEIRRAADDLEQAARVLRSFVKTMES